MTLSNSRQQFLAYESQAAEDIRYERRGGMFVTTCVCISFVVTAVIVAALVGVITYFITFFKLSQKPTNFWDEAEPFGQTTAPSADLRLSSTHVVPSFYRLKLITDLDNYVFNGEVYITVKATQKVNKIILHSKGLKIHDNAKLTEQIYEKVDSLHRKKRREAPIESNNSTTLNVTITETTLKTENKSEDSPNSTSTPEVELQVSTTEESATTTDTPIIQNDMANATDTQLTHSTAKNIKIMSVSSAPGDRLVLSLARSMQPGVDYILQLTFQGNITDSLTGFYKSEYSNAEHEKRVLGVTQFEPTSAREAFPCFDEPEFKAKFEISIAHPTNMSVLSNMKVSTEEPFPEKDNWIWTHFERSVNMSTYLVAYVLSDFKYLETFYTGQDNVNKSIRVWARPELIHKAKYALSITPKLLEYYEQIFGLPYALDKLDLVAIPDFSSGAMENWGLITFRETALLFDEVSSGPHDKQTVAIDVAHELAHQWFGNLVTMAWWTDLWLNEGFATYIEYVGVHRIHPEWNMLESFSLDKMNLLRTDALKNTSPVSREVIDASEISQKFDEISYNKGANLIRMLNHTISQELFLKGLQIYLNEWKFKNAEENDLWLAMTTAAHGQPGLTDLSVVKYMNSWTRQPGYPVLYVNRDYGTGEVRFEQKLFSTTKDPYPKMVKQIWQIPVTFTGLDNANYSSVPKLWLKHKTASLRANVSENEALYVNFDAIGYYRVNYDTRNWELLREALKSGKVRSNISRAQLIDDSFNLAKVGQLNYSYPLSLSTFVKEGEDSKIVWDLLLGNLGFLKHNLRSSPSYGYFLEYVQSLITKQLATLNYGDPPPASDTTALLTENLLSWECRVQTPRCLAWARQLFQQAQAADNVIPAYLRGLVYSVAVRHGSREDFMFLWRMFQNSTDPTVKNLVIGSLPATQDVSLINFLLEKSITEIPKQYAVYAWGMDSAIGTHIAQDFLINNWARVYQAFAKSDTFLFPEVLNGAFGSITTQEELDKLKSFAVQHKSELLPVSQTLQKLVDSATLRIGWIAQHRAEIEDWLKEYVEGSHAETTGATTHISTETNSNVTSTSSTTPQETATEAILAPNTTTISSTEATTESIITAKASATASANVTVTTS
ncbi:aminopeptidase N isoform X1 [Plutella xylostella]|uniref:aminopeptidase N isoform X1 n=1 Tax=Plutella xylostella TaxID=51655 RepID=UPI002032DF28|nr:aminopeptidase N isoform X1 [Plutella xylostella]XP_048478801.1 aminopeptidase N isoform X1 [Plutella xylostella]